MTRVWLAIVLIFGAVPAVAQTPPTAPPTPAHAPVQAAPKPEEILQRCRGILSNAARDRNPDVRKGAAEALSLVGVNDIALELLPPMLNDRDVTVRVAVVNTLGDLTENRAFVIPLLNKALSDPVPEVDFAAAKVLYQMNDPQGAEFLLEVVNKESKATSSYVSKERRTALRLLHTPQKLFMTIAIEAAGFAPVPGLGFGLSSAQGILSDPDSSARAASLLVIGNTSNPDLEDVVRSAFSDKEWSVRAAAAHVTAMHPFPKMRDSLPGLLDDKKESVQVRAAAAYIRLEHPPKPAPVKRRSTTHPPAASSATKPAHS